MFSIHYCKEASTTIQMKYHSIPLLYSILRGFITMGSEIHRVAQYNEQNYYITSMKQAAINVTYVYNFFEIIHNPIIILKCIFQSES